MSQIEQDLKKIEIEVDEQREQDYLKFKNGELLYYDEDICDEYSIEYFCCRGKFYRVDGFPHFKQLDTALIPLVFLLPGLRKSTSVYRYYYDEWLESQQRDQYLYCPYLKCLYEIDGDKVLIYNKKRGITFTNDFSYGFDKFDKKPSISLTMSKQKFLDSKIEDL